MSSSGAAAADAAARLALLSGPDLVAHLGTTSRRSDWDAAARVLGDRDRRLAEAEDKATKAHTDLAELKAEVEVLMERFLELKQANERRGPGPGPGSGAIAATAAPRVGRRDEEPGPEGAIVDLCSSSSEDDDDDEEEELEEGEFRLRPAGVAGVSCKRKEEPAASKGDQGRSAGVSCQRKEPTASNGEEERTPAGVSCKREEPAASKGDQERSAGVSCQRKEPTASNGKEQTPAGVSCNRKEPAASNGKQQTPAGVSCKPKEPAASKGDEGRRAGVSCQQQESASKRKAPASACSPDDEDDKIPLSQFFMKKQRRAQPGANGKLNMGRGDTQVNSAGLLGVDRPAISPLNRGIPEAVAERMVGRLDDPKVAAFVQGTGNGQSGKNGGLSRTMPSPPPTASTAGNSPRKNCSKPDGSEGRKRIGEKQGHPVARPENDAPVQLRTPRFTDTARRIVGSARVGAETPMEHTDSSSDNTINVVLKSVEGQEQGIDGVRKTKVSLETNGTGNRGQVLNTKVLSRIDVIREQGSKLSPGQSWIDAHGGRPTTSDKPVSTTLRPENQLALHSEQMSGESSLPSAVTRNWKSSSAVFGSCLGNSELCMQAACALHRKIKLTTQPTIGGLTKYDKHRLAALVEFLLDGNLHGPLKRTADDLEKHDSTGLDFLERVVMLCSEQLFSIYRNKDDKYFR